MIQSFILTKPVILGYNTNWRRMTNEFEKQLLKEIFRIADQLIQSNKVNPQGTIWKTFSYNDRYDPPIFYEEKVRSLQWDIGHIILFIFTP